MIFTKLRTYNRCKRLLQLPCFKHTILRVPPKRFFAKISLAALQIVLLFTLASCNCCPKFMIPYFKSCRRPQVIVNREPCIIDYEPCILSCSDVENDDVYGISEELVAVNPNTSGTAYKLVKGDVVQVGIFGDDELNLEQVTVAPDGYIYYAHLDGIYAVGKTMAEIREIMTEKVKDLFVEPAVTLNLMIANDYTFTILGKVNNPGVYPIIDSLRLREAIGIAGGIQKERFYDKNINAQLFNLVNLERSFVVRDNEKIRPDFESILESCSDSQNMYIKPGDYIFLAPKDSDAVYLIGSAILPNRIPYVKDLTISEVLSQGIGWETMQYQYKAADLSKLLVVRGSLECPQSVEIDIKKILYGEARDFYLMPGDIVYLQNKELRFGRELVNIAIRTFFDSFGFSAGRYWGREWFPNE
jgi:polysaccharide biosynthesis/export protein